MLRRNIITALRYFRKNSAFSIINTLGLAIGIAAFLIIAIYARYEFGYDNFHLQKDNIYRVALERYDKGELSTEWAGGCAGIGPALVESFPEAVQYTKLYETSGVIRYGETFFKENDIFFATEDFFEMFSVELVEGIDSLVLREPYSVVISESTAQKYFGSEEPIGKTLKHDESLEYTVTGVFQDIPKQSHLRAEMLYSFSTFVDLTSERAIDAWDWDGFYTYVLLNEGTTGADFESKIPDMVQERWGEDMAQYDHNMIFKLQPIDEIHLYSDLMYEIKANGNGDTTFFLLIIAGFIIALAWVNYINLSTAKSMERAKEVGIRKVVGSDKRQIALQFLIESYALNLFAILIACLLIYLVLPAFNSYSGLSLTLDFTQPYLWWLIIGVWLIGSLLAGLYPSLVLAGYKPGNVLKGKLSTSASGTSIRKSLVVFQFITSLVLMVGTLTVFEQLRFMQNQSLGVNIEQTLVLDGPEVVDSLYSEQFLSFKNTLKSYSPILGVSSSTVVPGTESPWNAGGIRLVEEDAADSKQYRVIGIDGEFIDMFELEMVAGRKFDDTRVNEREAILFNESALEVLGLEAEESLGRDIYFWGDTFAIAGIMKDYHHESLKESYEPLIFRYFPAVTNFYSIKINTANLPETIAYVEEQWNATFPGNPFSYFFLDEHFNDQYQDDLRFGKVFGVFAGLAIFIACLGLFGLTLYITKQRTKEIGIRKVLGASVPGIIQLLSWDFSRLLLVAIFLAVPVSWWLMQQWLEGFATRIPIAWWLFALPALGLLMIAGISIAYQTTKLAISNPVNALKDE